MTTITYPDSRAPRDVNVALLAFLLVILSPVLIAAGFAVYIWTRFRGAPAAPREGKSLERRPGIKTMSEAMDLLGKIEFRKSFPGPLSSAVSIFIDLIPSALSATRITAGLVYPYPRSFEPIMLESQDGTPVCGHLAMQSGDARRPALILASGACASKNAGWVLSLALHAYYDWGFHVLAMDLRNRGDSGRFSEAPTSWGYRESDDILAAADYLDSLEIVSTVGVCGAGMAGSASLIAAGRSRLDRPLAGGVVAMGAYAEASSEVARLSGRSPSVPTASLRRLLQRTMLFMKTLADGPRGFFDPDRYTREVSCQYYEMTESDLFSKASPVKMMSEIEVPCLLVHARDDLMSPVGDAHDLLAAAGENPMVSALIVPSGGHELYGPGTRGWLSETLETFFTYWGEFSGSVEEVIGLAGIDSLDIFGNPDN